MSGREVSIVVLVVPISDFGKVHLGSGALHWASSTTYRKLNGEWFSLVYLAALHCRALSGMC